MISTPSITAIGVDMFTEIKKVIRHPLFQFTAATIFAYVIFFARSPVNFVLPTLYAEDGTWSTQIFYRGFLNTVMKVREDYYVVGNLTMLWLGMRFCDLFYAGDILMLAKSYAIISMFFFAATVSLPFLLLRRILSFRYLALLWILLGFVPLGLSNQSGYEIIGRINNTGFSFLFIGFLLVIYRNRCAGTRYSMLLSDTGLVICAATNPFCLLFIPAVIWPYLKGVLCHHSQTGILNRKGLVSLTMLVIMSAIIAFKPLTTSMEPYKDLTIKLTPSMVVEIGVARNIIYPVIHPYYHKMGTVSVLLILVLTVGIIAKFGKKENYGIYAGAGLLLLITTVVLVITRPMLRFNADGYSSTYPDRYYFAQNMIGIVILVIFANDLESRISGRWFRFLPLILLLVNSFLPINRNAPGKLSSSQFIPADNGLFCDQVVQSYEHYLLMPDKTHPPGMPYLRVYIFPNDPKCSVKLPLDRVRNAIRKRNSREGS